MKPFPVLALASLLVLPGCAELGGTAGEDSRRLEGIDRRFSNGEFDYALQETIKYVEEYPDSSKGWSLLGWVYVKTDNLEKAQECFDKALGLDPQWDNAYVGKGAAYRKAGDNANARKSYLEAIRILPDNAEAYSSLLVIEILEGNDERAVEYGEKAWGLRKDLASIPANLAIAYHYVGNVAKRDEYYQQAERLGYHRLQTVKEIFDGKASLR